MNTSHTILRKIALAIFKNKKIMMVRDNKHNELFSFLGGKINEKEDDLACINREVKEEVNAMLILSH